MADDFNTGNENVGDAVPDAYSVASDENPGENSSFSWDNIQPKNDNVNIDNVVAEGKAEEDGKAEEEPEKSDDKIPDEKGETEADQEETEKPKNRRSMNHSELQKGYGELQEQLKVREEEKAVIESRFEKVNVALEAYGGVEQVEKLIDKVDKFINPTKHKEVADYIFSLPHKEAITADILNRSFGLENGVEYAPGELQQAYRNRETVLNSALVRDFGLDPKNQLKQDQLETLLNFVAAKANFDKEDWEEWLNERKDETEVLADDSEPVTMRVLRRENEKLQSQLEQKTQPEGREAADTNFDYNDPKQVERLHADLSTYEQGIFNEQVNKVLAEYSTTLEKLDPDVAEAIHLVSARRSGSSALFTQMIEYIARKQTSHENFTFLESQFKNSIKTLLNLIVPKFVVKSKTNAPNSKQVGNSRTLGDGGGKSSLQPSKQIDEANPWAAYR